MQRKVADNTPDINQGNFIVRNKDRSRMAVVFVCIGLVLIVAATFHSTRSISYQSLPLAISFSPNNDEFVGPFPSWANVKTQYGAAGDGATDDTVPLQKALNDLGQSGKPSVMYLPAGTYKITSTLTLAARIHVSIIGEDPATTTIVWAGRTGGTMLYINGVAYSRFNRLTWDGQGKAGIAVDQSKADGSSQYFDTANEYADDTFTDVGFGIHGGFLGFGFAETSVLRSHFIRNTQAGIALGNFNALDLFVWNSTFVNCNQGVTNTPGAGNFNVYNSIFSNSAVADIHIGNTGGFNFRNNFSSGSNAFIVADGTGNPATITIQRNTILDPISKTSISIGNEGPVLLVDNAIRNSSSATAGPVVIVKNWNPSDLFSIGNTFTVTNAIAVNGRIRTVDDRTVNRSSINPVAPSLPGTPPNYHRQVFEVPAGSSADVIQTIINTAARQKGSHPVVHLPPSQLFVNATLVIPANTDLQMVGDGGASMITWAGNGTGPVFRLAGPSKAKLRDFHVQAGGSAEGILVENADQAGSRVFMEQPYLDGNQQNLFVDRLDYTNVELQNFYHDGSGANQASVRVIGGPIAAAGSWLGGKTTIFSGNSSNNPLTYEALQGAHLTVRDSWYETSTFPQFIRLMGNSDFSFSGSRVALPLNSNLPMIEIYAFTGKAIFLTSRVDGNIAIHGDGSQAKVLGIGLVGPSQNYFSNSASPAAQALLLSSATWNSTRLGSGASQISEQGAYDLPFIRSMLGPIRMEQPADLASLPGGVTDVQLYRIIVQQGLIGVHLTH